MFLFCVEIPQHPRVNYHESSSWRQRHLQHVRPVIPEQCDSLQKAKLPHTEHPQPPQERSWSTSTSHSPTRDNAKNLSRNEDLSSTLGHQVYRPPGSRNGKVFSYTPKSRNGASHARRSSAMSNISEMSACPNSEKPGKWPTGDVVDSYDIEQHMFRKGRDNARLRKDSVDAMFYAAERSKAVTDTRKVNEGTPPPPLAPAPPPNTHKVNEGAPPPAPTASPPPRKDNRPPNPRNMRRGKKQEALVRMHATKHDHSQNRGLAKQHDRDHSGPSLNTSPRQSNVKVSRTSVQSPRRKQSVRDSQHGRRNTRGNFGVVGPAQPQVSPKTQESKGTEKLRLNHAREHHGGHSSKVHRHGKAFNDISQGKLPSSPQRQMQNAHRSKHATYRGTGPAEDRRKSNPHPRRQSEIENGRTNPGEHASPRGHHSKRVFHKDGNFALDERSFKEENRGRGRHFSPFDVRHDFVEYLFAFLGYRPFCALSMPA